MKDVNKSLDFSEFSNEFTDDAILDGLISIRQPKKGYRVAMDPIILASYVKVLENQSILDVGCGVGAISLILKFRIHSAHVKSIDIDPNMCELCQYNAQKNALELDVQRVGVEEFSSSQQKQYDLVVTNPPFFKRESSRISKTKITANFETMELSRWISLCLKLLKPHGAFYMIHEPSRISDILTAIKGRAGSAVITPVYSGKLSKRATRIIIQCTKNNRGETSIANGVIIKSRNNL